MVSVSHRAQATAGELLKAGLGGGGWGSGEQTLPPHSPNSPTLAVGMGSERRGTKPPVPSRVLTRSNGKSVTD